MDVLQQQPPVMYQKLSPSSPDVQKKLYTKGSTMSPTNERDAGFCSGSSENEEDLHDLHQHNHQLRLINNSSECSNSSQSASAVSEDSSLDDKFVLPTTPVTPITTMKNKRKSSEPTRVVASSDLSQCAPIKKRIKLENEKMMAKAQEEAKLKVKQEQITMTTTTTSPLLSPDPFRPWTHLIEEHKNGYPLNPAHSFKRHPGVTTLHRNPIQEEDVEINLPQFLMPVQEEPIALVAKKPATPEKSPISSTCLQALSRNGQLLDRSSFLKQQQQRPHKSEDPRPAHQNMSRTPSLIDETSSTASSFISPAMTLNLSVKAPHSESSSPARLTSAEKKANKEAAAATQRNYKNMTRERRIEANARERTRVHTISAAFEKLRHSVPAYSNTQKLSKLSVLRIACSYIMSLSRIAGMDYSEDQSEPSINECVDALTKTIQTEGKLRKKKDE